jgi:hypothetical protein
MASSHPDCKVCGDVKCPKYLDLALWGIQPQRCLGKDADCDFRADIAYDRQKDKEFEDSLEDAGRQPW